MRREGREREKNKEEKRERESSLALTLIPPCRRCCFFFSAQMSLRCPHYLNAWNRLIHFGCGGNRQQQDY